MHTKKNIYPYIPKLLLPYSYHYRIYHHHHHYYNHSYLSHCQLHIVMIFVVGDNIEGRRKVVTNITYRPQWYAEKINDISTFTEYKYLFSFYTNLKSKKKKMKMKKFFFFLCCYPREKKTMTPIHPSVSSKTSCIFFFFIFYFLFFIFVRVY